MALELWDGGEGVCCAQFQLGACPHTEDIDYAEGCEHPYTHEETILRRWDSETVRVCDECGVRIEPEVNP